MGDDDARGLGGLQLVHTVGHDAHSVHVESRVGLVEDGELGFQHSHLEDFVAFLLATREALVDGAVGELRIQLHDLALLAHQLEEVGGVHGLQSLIFALLVDGGLHEVGHGHTGNLHRILEREEQPLVGAVFGLHLQEVLAVEDGLAAGHLVERIAHEDGTQGGLSRTVRSHDGVYLTVADGEVDTFQYFFASNRGVQVLDF